MSQLELRTGISAKGTPWVDYHFKDTGPNCFMMSSILTNVLIVQQMLCNLREAAVMLGRLPQTDKQGPRWKTGSNRGIFLNPDFVRGETLCAELTLAQQSEEATKKDDDDNQKLAVLANLKLPQIGDYYVCGPMGATIYSDKALTTISGKIDATKTFGPIIDFSSYRLDSAKDFIAGLVVEFMHKTSADSLGNFVEYHAWAKITENAVALCSLSSGPAPTIWDDDAAEESTEPASSSSAVIGSGVKREVTPSIAPISKVQWPKSRKTAKTAATSSKAKVVTFDPEVIAADDAKEQLKAALQQKMEELDKEEEDLSIIPMEEPDKDDDVSL